MYGEKSELLAKWKSPHFRRQCAAAAVFVLPAILILLVFLVYPTIRLFFMSVSSENYVGKPNVFVGLENYRTIFATPAFHRSVWASFLFGALGLPIQLGIALLLAVLLVKGWRGQTFFRTMYFIPVVMSMLVVSLLWKCLYSPNVGLLNNLLNAIGVMRQGWLSDVDQALYCILATYTWKTFGFYMMIYISALKAIPLELYESSDIDGAKGFQKFWYITFPMIKPATLFVVVIGSINIIVKSVVPVFTMTEGGPRNATTTLVYYIWRQAFRMMEVGFASAAAVILFLVVIAITVVQFLVGDKDNTV